MNKLRTPLTVTLLSAALLAAACSPEAGRTRGARGADIGNRPSDPSAVQIHGKTNPAFEVPEVGRGIRK